MNQLSTIAARLLALALLATSLPSHAVDASAVRAANNVGSWIATQGNAALHQINDDLRRTLLEQLRPMLPEPQADTRSPQP